MTLVTRTAKLIPRTKRLRPLPGLATAYSYEPDVPEAHGLGGLYVVIEVLIPQRPAQTVIDIIIETVGDQYYNWQSERPVPILERFERAVKATNAALAKHTASGNASWIGRMSAVIALLDGEELHISQTGSAEAFLYRASVTSHITDGGASASAKHSSTFGSIASGAVQAGDRLLLSTPALFHGIGRPELKALINDNSATAAVHKLSSLMNEHEEADRIAAIIVEITTSDLLAFATREQESDEATVGVPDKALDIAKAAALPVAKKIGAAGMEATHSVIAETNTKLVPRLKATAALGAERISRDVKNASGRRRLAIAGAAIIILVGALIGWQHQNSVAAQTLKDYDAAYATYARGLTSEQAGDKQTARSDFTTAKANLEKLAKKTNVANLNTQLTKRSHPESDPASVTALLQAISDRFDELDNLVRLESTVVADLAPLKNAKPTQMELVGNKLIMVDSNNSSAIYIYDLAAKTLITANKPATLGKVVATTVNAAGDGIYLLTSTPAVWSMQAFDGAFASEDISFGGWPKARSIASYASSLYLLSSDGATVTKHIRTAAGFAAGSDYFKDPTVVGGATSLAVDGSVYLAGGTTGISRFLSGVLSQKATGIPDTLKNPDKITSLANANLLVTFNESSHRVGVFSNLDNAVTFTKQFSFKLGEPTAAAADSKGTTIYAVVGNKLVSATLPK